MLGRDSLIVLTALCVMGVPIILWTPGAIPFGGRIIFASISGWLAMCGLCGIIESVIKQKTVMTQSAIGVLSLFVALATCITVVIIMFYMKAPVIYHVMITIPFGMFGMLFMAVMFLSFFRRKISTGGNK